MTSSFNAINGTDTANTLVASSLADDIKAFAGDDFVSGAGNNDVVDLGLGNDTLTTAPNAGALQMGKVSVLGGGGFDSLYLSYAVSSATVRGGENDDTIYLNPLSRNRVYGDKGSDTIHITGANSRGSVYGGNTTDATSLDGNDSIIIDGSPFAALIHGNGGNDTMYAKSGAFDKTSLYGGQGQDYIYLQTTLSSSYITGNLGNDTITTNLIKGGTVFGGGGYLVDTSNDGHDSIMAMRNISEGSLIHGNGGNDTLYIGGLNNEVLRDSSIYGGQGDDSIEVTGAGGDIRTALATLVTGNLGNDTIDIGGNILNASIYGGSGDNYINFGDGFDQADGSTNNTYFFGSTTGNDTLNFNSADGGLKLTVAVEETQGVVASFTFNSSDKTLSLGAGKSIFLDGYTGTRINDINSLGITFTTVSSAAITSLG